MTPTFDPQSIVGKSRSLTGRRALDDNVYDAALERVRHTYATHDHVAVSFSGGKDSTATLHVTLDVAHELGRLPVRVIFWDEECISYETEDYVRRVALRDDVAVEWLCLPVKHRNACSNESPFWYPWAPEAADLWVRPMPPEAITELEGFPTEPPAARYTIPEMNGLMFTPEQGRCALMMGIRAAESIRRMQAVIHRADDNYIVPLRGETCPTLRTTVNKVYPVYDWLTDDVWTAPALHGWDHNATYDVQEMVGISAHSQRCAPPFGEEPMQKLWLWAQCFPDLWARMVERVPGAGTAARYSTTELYDFGSVAPKPDQYTWEQWVVELLGRFGDDARKDAVANLRALVINHYAKTADPILPHARHPASSASWEFLATIAKRGDLKQRRLRRLEADPEKLERMQVEYDFERAAIEAETGMRITADNCGQLR